MTDAPKETDALDAAIDKAVAQNSNVAHLPGFAGGDHGGPIAPREKTTFTYKAPEGLTLVTFDVALADFIESTKRSSNAARMASELALVHYFNTGDLSYCQRMYDSIPKGYVRRQAFVRWLGAFMPVVIENHRLFKDKRPEAVEMTEENVVKALSKSFWEFAPDPEEIELDVKQVKDKVLGTIRSLHGARYTTDVAAKAMLAKMEDAVRVLH